MISNNVYKINNLIKNEANNNSRLKKINSMMLAVLLSSNFIAMMLASLNIIEDGVLPIIFVIVLMISCSSVFLTKGDLKINTLSMFFIIFIFITFMFSFFFRGNNSYVSLYFIDFLIYGMIIYLLVNISFSEYNFIRNTMLIGNIILLNPIGFVKHIGVFGTFGIIEMGATYAILPSVSAAIIHYFFYREKCNWMDKISYLTNVYLFIIIILNGTRGGMFALGLLLCLIVYIKIYSRLSKKRSYLYPVIFILVIILGFYLLSNFQQILLSLYYFSRSIGINFVPIIKTYELFENGGIVGILNGRDGLYKDALALFSDSPIFGYGIGSFADNYNGSYPHNLFLQLLVEGGLILFIPICIILILCAWSLLKPWSSQSDSNNLKLVVLLLFIVSVPKLMLSSYLWQEQSFWLLIFIFLSMKKKVLKSTVK